MAISVHKLIKRRGGETVADERNGGNKVPRWFLMMVMALAFAVVGLILKNANADIGAAKSLADKHELQIPELSKRLDIIDSKLETNRREYREDSQKIQDMLASISKAVKA